jgi:electron transfer flavoprotein alpha subunit
MMEVIALAMPDDESSKSLSELGAAACEVGALTKAATCLVSLSGDVKNNGYTHIGFGSLAVCLPGLPADLLPHRLAVIVEDLVHQLNSKIIIMLADGDGEQTAALLANSIGAAFIGGCIAFELVDGGLQFHRRIAGGKAVEVVASTTKTTVVTIARGAFRSTVIVEHVADTQPLNLTPRELPPDTLPRLSLERLENDGVKPLESASIVIAGGRGLGSQEGFEVLKLLADELGAAVGASRAAVDMGWVPHSMQIGQTGKTVTPDLYIAVGISGAPQHLAGMAGARMVVAINTDEQAPIFDNAHIGVVANYRDLLPALTKAVHSHRSRTPNEY